MRKGIVITSADNLLYRFTVYDDRAVALDHFRLRGERLDDPGGTYGEVFIRPSSIRPIGIGSIHAARMRESSPRVTVWTDSVLISVIASSTFKTGYLRYHDSHPNESVQMIKCPPETGLHTIVAAIAPIVPFDLVLETGYGDGV